MFAWNTQTVPELLHTSIFGLPPARIGKVREVYDLGDEVLIVATDRISAFDAVMANGIPDKGMILTQMSAFWFAKLADICPHHVISVSDSDVQARCPQPQPEIYGRTTVAKKAKTIPVECVARGYITGSLFKQYRKEGGKILGLDLPEGLQDGDRLPEPIFTPATKAEEGHDENISFASVVDQLGSETADYLKSKTLEIYARASQHAESCGIILADTKFEFGEHPDGILWIDEALTPDSSRYWPADTYAPGQAQPSYDKQFVRDYLETSGWDKNPPGPMLPDLVVANTRAKYVEAFTRLTGRSF